MSNVIPLDRQKGKIAKDALLGRIIWYYIPENDALLDFQHVVNCLQTAGFTRKMPNEPQDRNVFLRVTKSAERRMEHAPDPTQTEQWMVRDLSSDNQTITRRLVMELRDPEGESLHYYEVLDFIFDRTTKNLRFKWVGMHDKDSDPTAVEIIKEINAEYAKWRGRLTAYTVREWIRKALLDMGAVPAKKGGGGVYFLQGNDDQIQALETFVDQMIPNGGQCFSVEIPDNSKMREMVRQGIEDETLGEIERKMVEIGTIRKAGKLTPEKYMELMGEVAGLTAKMQQYEKLLETDMNNLSARLDLLQMTTKGLSPLQKKITRTRKSKSEPEEAAQAS